MTTIVTCKRCGAPCKVSDERNPDARLLRHADEGLCGNCAVTAFFKRMEPLATVLAAKGPEVLLDERAQEQFGRVLMAANSDADLSEINWEIVVSQWELA